MMQYGGNQMTLKDFIDDYYTKNYENSHHSNKSRAHELIKDKLINRLSTIYGDNYVEILGLAPIKGVKYDESNLVYETQLDEEYRREIFRIVDAYNREKKELGCNPYFNFKVDKQPLGNYSLRRLNEKYQKLSEKNEGLDKAFKSTLQLLNIYIGNLSAIASKYHYKLKDAVSKYQKFLAGKSTASRHIIHPSSKSDLSEAHIALFSFLLKQITRGELVLIKNDQCNSIPLEKRYHLLNLSLPFCEFDEEAIVSLENKLFKKRSTLISEMLIEISKLMASVDAYALDYDFAAKGHKLKKHLPEHDTKISKYTEIELLTGDEAHTQYAKKKFSDNSALYLLKQESSERIIRHLAAIQNELKKLCNLIPAPTIFDLMEENAEDVEHLSLPSVEDYIPSKLKDGYPSPVIIFNPDSSDGTELLDDIAYSDIMYKTLL